MNTGRFKPLASKISITSLDKNSVYYDRIIKQLSNANGDYADLTSYLYCLEGNYNLSEFEPILHKLIPTMVNIIPEMLSLTSTLYLCTEDTVLLLLAHCKKLMLDRVDKLDYTTGHTEHGNIDEFMDKIHDASTRCLSISSAYRTRQNKQMSNPFRIYYVLCYMLRKITQGDIVVLNVKLRKVEEYE